MLHEFSIPALPPSVNSVYRFARGHVYKKESVKDFDMLVLAHIKRPAAPICVPCSLDITFTIAKRFSVADVDNLLKITLDSLQTRGVIANDNLVYEIRARKQRGEKDMTQGVFYALKDSVKDGPE